MTLKSNRSSALWLATAFVTSGLAPALQGSAMAQGIQIASPDGGIAATITPADGTTTYAVTYKGKPVIESSAIGISVDGQNLGSNAELGKPTTRSFKETYPVFGSHRVATNAYNEAIIPISGGTTKVPWTLEVRAFNDGFAYRYRVPVLGNHKVDGETSQWKLPADSVLWYQVNTREYETAFREMLATRVTPGATIAAPVTAKLAGGLGYAMITEANLVNYSDMAYKTGGPGEFNALFDKDPQGWNTTGAIVSPWRVTLVAKDLTSLVNTDLLTNLCPAPAPELVNAAWIQPGRSNWHWMVTGHPN